MANQFPQPPPSWNEPLRAIKDFFEYCYWLSEAFFTRLIPWVWGLTPGSWPPLARLVLAGFIVAAPFIILSPRGPVLRFAWRAIFGRSELFGGARWASRREIRRAGLLRPGGRFLGQFVQRRFLFFSRSDDLFTHGEGHCLTVAAQGGGKTTGLIIPTLITYRGGPVVVTDPKGAITAQTRRLREGVGRVVVLNPWGDELRNDPSFGLDLGDEGFNPLAEVGPTQDGMQAAATVAALLSPDRPGEESYFTKEARALLQWGMVWLAANNKPRCTLPGLHDLLFNTADLLKIIESNASSIREGPGRTFLKRGAQRIMGMIDMNAGGQLAGIVGTATAELSIYSEETRLAEHVSRDGFRLSDLKGGQPLTVFLICPPDHLVTDDRKWLNLVLAMICQQIGRPGKAVETVLLLDEFPALGYLPNIMGALEQFREAGLRAHMIAQNPGQILTTYGADGLRRLWGIAETKQVFRMTDAQQAQELSAMIGDVTEENLSYNPKGEANLAFVGVPLIRPDELLRMPADRQIILRPNMRPIRAQVFPFYKRKEWAALVDRNPYRGQG